ncbi:hypothetical protein [Skermania piniformis]|uniref:Low molecular weight antigen MTB12-like C-terminal domain-containing protein n=1 Tax=Skermania pinensis TaxID=39122 RepID=A0ABX8SCY3_9ACTN|nr:hypothetical protein [Skermania piniformis]QXQ15027.1 hypothetical protein KV203_06640 [Skermania piniformis]
MHIRVITAAVAGAAILTFGAACSSDDSSSSSGETSSTTHHASSTTPSTAAAGAESTSAVAAMPLTDDVAQQTVRDLFDPAVPGTVKVTHVAGATDADAGLWDQFAQGASQGGYTPDVVTVTGTSTQGDTATAQVAIASPHAPAPVTVPMDLVYQDGSWRLAAASAQQLLAMGQGGAPGAGR